MASNGIESALTRLLRHKLDCHFEYCSYALKGMLSWAKSAVGTTLLVSLLFAPHSYAGDAGNTDRGDLHPPVHQISPSYKIQAGIDGEIYPVFANYASLQR